MNDDPDPSKCHGDAYVVQAVQAVWNAKLFITTNPDVIVGPVKARDGDQVASVPGKWTGGVLWLDAQDAVAKPAPYTPGGSAPPKPWARDVGELAARVTAIEKWVAQEAASAFASKPAPAYRAWRSDKQDAVELWAGSTLWSKGPPDRLWEATKVKPSALEFLVLHGSRRELKGPELDEIVREFVERHNKST
jgi:hypothetical protein